MRPVLGWAWRILVWTVLLAALAVLAVAVLVPRAGGATPYAVLTGSMTPTYPVGTLVVSKPVAPEEIKVGSAITYQLESGRASVVTHRVVGQGIDSDGQPLFRTQGDANPVPDQEWVRPVQVRGEVWYAVPHLGRVNSWLTGPQRQTVVYAVAALLLGYAGVMLAGGLLDRRRTRRRPAGSKPEEARA